MRKRAALLLVLALAGCGESMDRQNKLKPYGEAKAMPGWPAEGEALPLPPGVVAQGSGSSANAEAEAWPLSGSGLAAEVDESSPAGATVPSRQKVLGWQAMGCDDWIDERNCWRN